MATVKLVDFDHVTDYISREDAVQCADDVAVDFENDGLTDASIGAHTVGNWLKDMPAADVRPVVRASWKAHGDCGVTECPVCRWSIEECIDYNFCPCCGADMREPNLDTTKGERRDESSG